MDDLTASQMIAYMRSLAGHALRNHRQYFSAAFNLNTPLKAEQKTEATDVLKTVDEDRKYVIQATIVR